MNIENLKFQVSGNCLLVINEEENTRKEILKDSISTITTEDETITISYKENDGEEKVTITASAEKAEGVKKILEELLNKK